MKILQSYPSPNHTPAMLQHQQLRIPGQYAYIRNNLSTRLDYRLGETLHLLTGGLENGSRTPQNRWGSNSFTNLAFPPWCRQQSLCIGGGHHPVSNTMIVDVRYGVTRVNTNASFPTGTSFDYSAYGSPRGAEPDSGAGPLHHRNFAGTVTPRYASFERRHVGPQEGEAVQPYSHRSVTKVHGSWTFKSGAEYRVYLSNWQICFTARHRWVVGRDQPGKRAMVDAYGNPRLPGAPAARKGFDAATA